ncbi:MAG: hypothetical protein AB1921_00875 [Thermodesulfobacteriota bacterium]
MAKEAAGTGAWDRENRDSGPPSGRKLAVKRLREGFRLWPALLFSWLAEASCVEPEPSDRESRLLLLLYGRPRPCWPGAVRALFWWAAAVAFCLAIARLG